MVIIWLQQQKSERYEVSFIFLIMDRYLCKFFMQFKFKVYRQASAVKKAFTLSNLQNRKISTIKVLEIYIKTAVYTYTDI